MTSGSLDISDVLQAVDKKKVWRISKDFQNCLSSGIDYTLLLHDCSFAFVLLKMYTSAGDGRNLLSVLCMGRTPCTNSPVIYACLYSWLWPQPEAGKLTSIAITSKNRNRRMTTSSFPFQVTVTTLTERSGQFVSSTIMVTIKKFNTTLRIVHCVENHCHCMQWWWSL